MIKVSELSEVREVNKNKSPFTKEEIKCWVDLTRLQLKIIKVKTAIGKKKLFKAILKIIKKKSLTGDGKINEERIYY